MENQVKIFKNYLYKLASIGYYITYYAAYYAII